MEWYRISYGLKNLANSDFQKIFEISQNDIMAASLEDAIDMACNLACDYYDDLSGEYGTMSYPDAIDEATGDISELDYDNDDDYNSELENIADRIYNEERAMWLIYDAFEISNSET